MKNDPFDPGLKNALNDLHKFPPRNPQAAARGRANFLHQAALLRRGASREPDRRPRPAFPLFQGNRLRPALKILLAAVLVLILCFGGTSATVYAAQDSLPGQALYPLKTWSEDVLLSLARSPQARLDYALDFSDRRVTEMAGLLAAGEPLPESVEIRLQNELDLALELAAGMDDPQLVQQIERMRQRAETQLQAMTMLRSAAPESAQPVLSLAHTRLQEQVRLAGLGETDQQKFRSQVQQRLHDQELPSETSPTTGSTTQTPAPFQPTGTPLPSGTGNGPGGHESTVSPMPSGTGNGPGPGGNQPTGAPGDNGSGPHPPDQTPQPGQGPGHGP